MVSVKKRWIARALATRNGKVDGWMRPTANIGFVKFAFKDMHCYGILLQAAKSI